MPLNQHYYDSYEMFSHHLLQALNQLKKRSVVRLAGTGICLFNAEFITLQML